MKKIGLVFCFILFFSVSFQVNAQWFWQNPLPTGNGLTSVEQVNNDILISVGLTGTILKSTDGGNNWFVIYNQCNDHLYDVGFFNSLIGLAVGTNGTILKTANSGNTWIRIPTGVNKTFKHIEIIND
ncbi:MAG: hypothetical protein WAR59_01480, partial [Ignavibacteriaceae bacterium]